MCEHTISAGATSLDNVPEGCLPVKCSGGSWGRGRRLLFRVTSIGEQTLASFLEALAAKTPAPGGGASACVAGAIAAAQAEMVVAYSVGKKDLAAHRPRLESAHGSLSRARALLVRLADEDAAAYSLVNDLQRLPADDARRTAELPEALAASIQIPLAAMAACVDVLRLMESLAPITNRHLHSDLQIAAILAEASVRSSQRNVLVNAPSVEEAARVRAVRDAATLAASAAQFSAATRLACESKA